MRKICQVRMGSRLRSRGTKNVMEGEKICVCYLFCTDGRGGEGMKLAQIICPRGGGGVESPNVSSLAMCLGVG